VNAVANPIVALFLPRALTRHGDAHGHVNTSFDTLNGDQCSN
jgi:hypothetical protein